MCRSLMFLIGVHPPRISPSGAAAATETPLRRSRAADMTEKMVLPQSHCRRIFLVCFDILFLEEWQGELNGELNL